MAGAGTVRAEPLTPEGKPRRRPWCWAGGAGCVLPYCVVLDHAATAMVVPPVGLVPSVKFTRPTYRWPAVRPVHDTLSEPFLASVTAVVAGETVRLPADGPTTQSNG